MDDCMDLDHGLSEYENSKTTTEDPQHHEGNENNFNEIGKKYHEDNTAISAADASQEDLSFMKSKHTENSEDMFEDMLNENMSSFFGKVQVMDSEEFQKRMESMLGQNPFDMGINVHPRRKRNTKTKEREEFTKKIEKVAGTIETPPVAEERHDSLALPVGMKVVNFDIGGFSQDVGFMEDLATKMGERPLVSVFERKDWGASPPLSTEDLRHPVYYVNFTDTGVGTSPCHGQDECLARVKGLQRHHVDELGLPDIKYNWLIGSDGCLYEGRGWKHEGYRPPEIKFGIKSNCMHIAYIGDYSANGPPTRSIILGYSLVIEGFHKKFIAKEAKIISRENAKSDLDQLFQKYTRTHNF